LSSFSNTSNLFDAIRSESQQILGQGIGPKIKFISSQSVPVPQLRPLLLQETLSQETKTLPPQTLLPKKTLELFPTDAKILPPEKKFQLLPLSEKYRPHHSKDIFGNPKSIAALKTWIASRRRDPSTGSKNHVVATLTGPPGVGKTTAATVILKENGYGIFEVNASDQRTRAAVYDHIKSTVTRKGLKKPMAIILDEIDGSVDNVGDNNSAILGVLDFIQECKDGQWKMVHPIICICNDTSSKLVRQLTKTSLCLKFFPPFENIVRSLLKSICQRERIRLTQVEEQRLIEASRGDLRKLLQLLQLFAQTGKKAVDIDDFVDTTLGDEFDDTFAATRKLLYQPGVDLETAERLVGTDTQLMTLMTEFNMPLLASQNKKVTNSIDELLLFYEDLSFIDTLNAGTYTGHGADLEDAGIPQTIPTLLGLSCRTRGSKFRAVRSLQQPVNFTDFFKQKSAGDALAKQKHIASQVLDVAVQDVDYAAQLFVKQKHTLLKHFREDEVYETTVRDLVKKGVKRKNVSFK